MNIRKLFIIAVTAILIGAVFTGTINAFNINRAKTSVATLENVRDYAPATTTEQLNYAVDSGKLFVGHPTQWTQVETPVDIIVSAVAVDQKDVNTLYIGAANEMAIYRSVDSGQSWTRFALSEEYIGGVTDIAVDSFQRLIYVGTDTAGLFRLRDVGSSLTLSAHLLLNEPVLQIVADSTGMGMAFARTEWHLYRAENFGLSWVAVDNLNSTPTAVAIANTQPATVYVGTVDRGLLKSLDGLKWTLSNEGLGMAPGVRLQVDALSIDPMQPEVLYVATSYLLGTTQVHSTPAMIAMSTDSAQAWKALETDAVEGVAGTTVAELLPVSGEVGAAYALTMQSRSPIALGSAPVVDEAVVSADVESGNAAVDLQGMMAWIIAGLAAIALTVAVAIDLRQSQSVRRGSLIPNLARVNNQ